MALRVLEYTVLLYKELLRTKRATLGGLPPVLAIVLYNGESPWSAEQDVADLIGETGPALLAYQPSQRHLVVDERHAEADYAGELTRAVALLEQSSLPAELGRVVGLVADLVGGPDQDELRHAFQGWLRVLFERMQREGGEEPRALPPELTLEEMQMTLEERVAQWPEQWRQRGVEQGIRQGLANQRELPRGQAEARFGTQTAERLSASLQREEDPSGSMRLPWPSCGAKRARSCCAKPATRACNSSLDHLAR